MLESMDKKQVGGNHYKTENDAQQHWNLVTAHNWDYFQAQIIKYVMRWKNKGGIEDLLKAQHFLNKYIEIKRPAEVLVQANRGDAVIAKRAIMDSMVKADKEKADKERAYENFLRMGKPETEKVPDPAAWPYPAEGGRAVERVDIGAEAGHGYVDQG